MRTLAYESYALKMARLKPRLDFKSVRIRTSVWKRLKKFCRDNNGNTMSDAIESLIDSHEVHQSCPDPE